MQAAGEIRVEGQCRNEDWQITIGNSTEGTPEYRFEEGHALSQIRERLALMNGNVDVTTEPGWFSVRLEWRQQ